MGLKFFSLVSCRHHLKKATGPPRQATGPPRSGASRYVEECWGFPYLKIKKVAWLWAFGFWLLGFKFSKFQGFKNLLCFQNVFGTILPNFHFMFFDRSCSHIHDFEDLLRGSSSLFGTRLCKFDIWGFRVLRFIKIICFKSSRIFLDFC